MRTTSSLRSARPLSSSAAFPSTGPRSRSGHIADNRLAVTANSLLLGPAIGLAAAAAAAILIIGLGPDRVPLPGYGLLAVGLAAVPAGTTVIYVINILTLRSRMDVVNRGYLVGALFSACRWCCSASAAN